MQQLNTAGALFMVTSLLCFLGTVLNATSGGALAIPLFSGGVFAAALSLFLFGLSDISRRVIQLLAEQNTLLRSGVGTSPTAPAATKGTGRDEAWLVQPKSKS